MDLKDYALVRKATLTDIGDGIREQEGSTEGIPPDEMGDRVRALARGGGVEYATGKATFAANVDSRKINHGLSKAPKIFFLYWDKYKTDYSLQLNAALYTENISCVWRGAADKITFNGMYTTVPGAYIPGYGAIEADETSVTISNVATSWKAGEWTWEAWTW